MLKKLLLLLMIITVFSTSGTAAFAKKHKKVPVWAHNRMVAHAGGQIRGYVYTNSLEALTATCKNKTINSVELDFMFTSDGSLVCTHNWYGVSRYPVLSTFLDTKCIRKFTTITARQAIPILAKHNKNLIIDTKNSNAAKVYSRLLKLCDEMDLPYYKSKLIPQIYKRTDYAKMRAHYRFKNGIYTLYKTKKLTKKKLKRACSYCKKKKLVLVIGNKRFFKRYKILKKYNVPVGVHTINRKRTFRKAKKKGATFIYSDKLF